MVAQTTQTPPEAARERTEGRPTPLRRPRGGLRRLITSSFRLAEVQYRIVLLKAKMTVMRMVLYAALITAGVLLALMGVIFLYIGVFRLLTDFAGLPVWATFLIYAGVHIITAVALIFGGARTIAGKDDEDEDADQERRERHTADTEGSK